MTTRSNSIAVVFDDHKLFAETFSSLIDRMGIFQSVRVFTDEKELIQFFIKNSTQQDIYFFVDYHLQDKHSIPIINDARRLTKRIKIIVVSSSKDTVLIQNILSYNVDGFLSKSSGFCETLECINALRSDRNYVSPYIADLLSEADKVSPPPFTVREIEILQYFDQGYSVAGTAEKVNLSKHTVVGHRRHMMDKADCNSITELLAFSRKRGLI